MKYQNAAEILPEKLLKELRTYVDGGYLYIPKATKKKHWGAESGSLIYYQERNKEIQKQYQQGCSIDMLTNQFGLAYSTIKNIIYR